MGVKRKNPGCFETINDRLKELEDHTVKVGWFQNAKEENGVYTAYAASVQEYGHGKIPPRLGLRQTIKAKKKLWTDFAKGASKQVLDGKIQGREAIELIGNQIHKDFYHRINSNPGPPLSDLTLALRKKREDGVKITGRLIGEISARLRRGDKVAFSHNTQTLVDTGHMLASLAIKVENA